MNRYKLIVFDWDGTLMDSTQNITQCMRQAIIDLELPLLPDHDIQQIIGLGLKEAVTTLYPDSDAALWTALGNRYREIWLGKPEASPLFDHAEALLTSLENKGYFLAVATGKGRRGLDKVLTESGIGKHFVTSRCADETQSKPHPQMLLEIIDYVGVNAADTLMIGDTEFDLLMAHNAGAESMGITQGAHSEERLRQCNPKGIIHNLQQFDDWLQQHSHNICYDSPSS